MPHCNFCCSCPYGCGSVLFGSHSMRNAVPLRGEFEQCDVQLGPSRALPDRLRRLGTKSASRVEKFYFNLSGESQTEPLRRDAV
jgi:hypothetical protein